MKKLIREWFGNDPLWTAELMLAFIAVLPFAALAEALDKRGLLCPKAKR